MIYSYWDKEDVSPIHETLVAWRSHFPEFQVFNDRDIEPIIAELFPDNLEIFRKIRIPTCKSDIALLLLLYKKGGLYIDCHCGIRDPESIKLLLGALDHWELILYDRDRTKERRPSYEMFPLNSVMFARRESTVVLDVARKAINNLAQHFELEKERGFLSYDIWSLTGPGNLADTLLIPEAAPSRLKPNYLGKICLIPEGEGEPITRYAHRQYRLPGMHWSERQKHELLFDHSTNR